MSKSASGSSLAYDLCRLLVRLIMGPYFRVKVVGIENVPAEGGYLMVSNHVSHLDPPVLGLALKRRLCYLAKSELFDIPLVGRLLAAINGLPIRRGKVDRVAMRRCRSVLESGEILVAFPEGTRSRTGQLQRGRPLVAMIGAQADVPCIPVYVEGSYRAMPPGTRLPRPRRIRVHYGEPFELPPRAPSMSSKEHYQSCADEMMRRIAELGGVDPPA